VVNGRIALARLDSMIEERERDLQRRRKALEYDRRVLETRRDMLGENRPVYLINREEVSRTTLNRDALLRARAYSTDQEICTHLATTLDELKAQRGHTAAEIEAATVEQQRLGTEVTALNGELENLKARRAVAQTRDEAAYIFDRSTFDEARDKVSQIRATIAEQNKRLDFYGRSYTGGKGLIPAGAAPEEDGVDAITAVLGDQAPAEEAAIAVAVSR